MSLYITKELNDQAKQIVNNELYKFNLKHFPVDLRGNYEEINVFLKDENDNVRGGILAEVCWNWLEIHTLMIDEDIRKLGFGKKLLLELEHMAIAKQCDFIKVDTLSFQALAFYEKHGYQVFGTLNNVGRDFKHYYLKKDLTSK
ncbi:MULTISPECIES: GNAT family N-acetyltransferase [unclassified Lysinibacillus]|uniref:GNAT family N-acetyltransferase n=1 Tax=unclassified Lysinibacillus TaxID=2636778 RepID=UPI003825568C